MEDDEDIASVRTFVRWVWCIGIIVLAIVATIIGLVVLLSRPAHAHDAPTGWTYPWSCCASMDCQQVKASAVEERPEGYVVQSTGEVVPYGDKRIKDSPDGEIHWCAHQQGVDAGHTICLFVPPKGF